MPTVDTPSAASPQMAGAPTYSLTSLAILATVIASCSSLVLLAHNDTVLNWFHNRQLAKWHSTNSSYEFNRGFIDFNGRMVYDEFERADYSKGGAYFIGSSNVVTSIMCWELPPEQRQLIHNYGLGGANYTQQFALIRFLVEQKGLLQAGGDKTTVVLGLLFAIAAGGDNRANVGFLQALFARHGLYNVDNEGIHPVPMPALVRWLLLEKARATNFLHYAIMHNVFRVKPPITEKQKKVYPQFYSLPFVGGTEPKMLNEIAQIGAMIDYLHARNVRVIAYFTPLGSWFRNDYEPASTFRRLATDVCAKKRVELIDLESFLTDEEFFDGLHPNYTGQKKIHPVLAGIAIENLHRTGALPAP